jgi:exodeoxyribonuclease VII large subunit
MIIMNETTPLAEPPILTVSQLTHAIKLSLESTFPYICLQGEVSNTTLHSSGHFYFTLKDAGAQIYAVMFKQHAISLKTLPKEGAQVIVKGEINVFPPSGKYQILVRELKPVGLGELLLKLEELKIKLHRLGWFRTDRKRPLPKLPKRIGVVTSPTGAAIQDMLNVLTRRFKGFHLILNPVKVQGEGAALEIAKAIEQFNLHDLVDVIIIGRGGGSIEDLWAFNEEIVAKAIFESRLPIISAVGHETDHCIADYVADVRAPTPSAAAEIVISERQELLNHLFQMQKRMQQTLLQQIRQDRHRLIGITRHKVLANPLALLGAPMQQLDSIKLTLNDSFARLISRLKVNVDSKKQLLNTLKPTTKLKTYKEQLQAYDRGITTAIKSKIQLLKIATAHNKESLDLINPKNLLSKGYSILFSEKDNSAITSVLSLKENQKVNILLSDGVVKAAVESISKK